MPVRDKAVAALASALDGPGPSFNSLDDTVKLGGQEISRDAYHDRYTAAYIRMVDAIDWNRVLLEASARHMELEHRDEGFDGYTAVSDDGEVIVGVICPQCLNEALLAVKQGGWTDWKREPDAPRDPHV